MGTPLLKTILAASGSVKTLNFSNDIKRYYGQ